MSDPHSNSVSPRRLPHQPNFEQLKKQAKELLERFRASESTAVAEVRQFERNPDPCHFALNDAQRVLARAYDVVLEHTCMSALPPGMRADYRRGIDGALDFGVRKHP